MRHQEARAGAVCPEVRGLHRQGQHPRGGECTCAQTMGVAWSPRHDAPIEYPWSKTEHAVLVSTTWVCPRLCLQCGWSALPLSGYAYGWYLQVTLLAPIEKKTNTTMMLPAV